MTASNEKLVVKTHVARDLLQSAALFKTDRLVVWEYVSNGLQYVDQGTQPVVRVVLDSRKKHISIADNGRGMDWAGLQNYFVMHGENVDRKAGKAGRGRFGTGKSAAFGIADILRITTIRKGKKSSVQLKRSDIERVGSGEPILIEELLREESTDEPNGTTVEIQGIHLRTLDQAGIVAYVERHLARWQGATVFVGHHECEFNDPPVAREVTFKSTGVLRDKLGDVELRIKVSKAPIDPPELRGIAIYSNSVWYETTLAGNEGRDMSQYLFGEIDVPSPQIAAAKGDSPDDNPIFRHLVNEVAFTEYAIGLVQELISGDEFLDLAEPVVEIRDTINRLARKAAVLYSKALR